MVNLSLHHGFSVLEVAMVLQASGSFLVGLAAHGQLLGSGTGDFSPLRGQGGASGASWMLLGGVYIIDIDISMGSHRISMGCGYPLVI